MLSPQESKSLESVLKKIARNRIGIPKESEEGDGYTLVEGCKLLRENDLREMGLERLHKVTEDRLGSPACLYEYSACPHLYLLYSKWSVGWGLLHDKSMLSMYSSREYQVVRMVAALAPDFDWSFESADKMEETGSIVMRGLIYYFDYYSPHSIKKEPSSYMGISRSKACVVKMLEYMQDKYGDLFERTLKVAKEPVEETPQVTATLPQENKSKGKVLLVKKRK